MLLTALLLVGCSAHSPKPMVVHLGKVHLEPIDIKMQKFCFRVSSGGNLSSSQGMGIVFPCEVDKRTGKIVEAD